MPHVRNNTIYPSYFKLHVRWLRLNTRPVVGLALEGPLQAAFKSAPGRFVARITYRCKLIGAPSLAACLKLELFRV
nr:hypothetical protein B7L52_00305 [Pectobacterium carotovorum]